MSCKDNKHHRKKQERFGDSSPTNFTDVHGFLNFQLSTFNFQFSGSQFLRFSDSKKSSVGAKDNRQTVKHAVRNLCKNKPRPTKAL